ncbi:hypothetical protein ACFL1T_04890, partial [Chlamydiota bacterium]
MRDDTYNLDTVTFSEKRYLWREKSDEVLEMLSIPLGLGSIREMISSDRIAVFDEVLASLLQKKLEQKAELQDIFDAWIKEDHLWGSLNTKEKDALVGLVSSLQTFLNLKKLDAKNNHQATLAIAIIEELFGEASALVKIVMHYFKEEEKEDEDIFHIQAQVKGEVTQTETDGEQRRNNTETVDADSNIFHAEGFMMREGKEGLWIDGKNLLEDDGVAKRKKAIENAKNDMPNYEIDGKKVFLSNRFMDSLTKKNIPLYWIGVFLEKQLSALPPLEDELYIDIVDDSEYLFEDHTANGYIAINKRLFTIIDPLTIIKLLQIGISHELKHEAGTRKEEAKLLFEDVIAAVEVGVGLGDIVLIEKAKLLIEGNRFLELLKPVKKELPSDTQQTVEIVSSRGKQKIVPDSEHSGEIIEVDYHTIDDQEEIYVQQLKMVRQIMHDPHHKKTLRERSDDSGFIYPGDCIYAAIYSRGKPKVAFYCDYPQDKKPIVVLDQTGQGKEMKDYSKSVKVTKSLGEKLHVLDDILVDFEGKELSLRSYFRQNPPIVRGRNYSGIWRNRPEGVFFVGPHSQYLHARTDKMRYFIVNSGQLHIGSEEKDLPQGGNLPIALKYYTTLTEDLEHSYKNIREWFYTNPFHEPILIIDTLGTGLLFLPFGKKLVEKQVVNFSIEEDIPTDDDSSISHSEGFMVEGGKEGLWVGSEDISRGDRVERRKQALWEENGRKADYKIDVDVDGQNHQKEVVLSSSLKEILGKNGIDYSWLQDYLTEQFKTSPPIQDKIYIDLLDDSSHLFEDCTLNGYIGINKRLFELNNPELIIKLLKIGLAHELGHEAGTEKSESELLTDDAMRAIDEEITGF